MDRSQHRRRDFCRKVIVAACTVAPLLFPAGCSMPMHLGHNEFGPALPENASVEMVVARVNANVQRIQSWQSPEVRISGDSLPIHLSGRIAVERPRNFRLVASVLGSDEADFGSNAERFWFWVKHAQMPGQKNYVFQARHEDVEQSDVLRQIPFQPDWLMEVLGVVPIEAHQVTLHPEKSAHIVNLISERLLPSGQPVKKVIRVDTQRGVVLGQSLHDASGSLIAKSVLEDYRVDKGGHIMPHRISLDWPQAGMKIALQMEHIEVNPSSIPRGIWQVPKKPYYPAYDIGARTRKRIEQAGGQMPGGVRRESDAGKTAADQESPFAKSPSGPAGADPSDSTDFPANDAPATSARSPRVPSGRSLSTAENSREWMTPIEPRGTSNGSAGGSPPLTPEFDDKVLERSPRQSSASSSNSASRDPFGFDDVPPSPPSRDGAHASDDPIATPPR